MKALLLTLLAVCACETFAFDLVPNGNDYRPPQPAAESDIYIQRRSFGGTNFGVMYKLGGFQIGKPIVVGYRLWSNAARLKTCIDDQDPRTLAFQQSLSGPKLVCANLNHKVELSMKDNSLKIKTFEFAGIGEAEGVVFKQISENQASVETSADSNCPISLSEGGDIASHDLAMCMKDLSARTARLKIKDSVTGELVREELKCTQINGTLPLPRAAQNGPIYDENAEDSSAVRD